MRRSGANLLWLCGRILSIMQMALLGFPALCDDQIVPVNHLVVGL
jgi:hypothetical protein